MSRSAAISPLWSWGIALGIHGALLGWLFGSELPDRTLSRRPPVKVKLVTRAKQEPQEPKQKAEPKQPEPKPEPKPKPKNAPPPRPRQPKPSEPPPKPPPPPPKLQVSMSATSPGGGVAVPATSEPNKAKLPRWAAAPTGTTSDKAAIQKTPKPPPPPRPRVLQASQVSKPPKLLGQPSQDELRRAYPRQAREDGLEANVVLKILVSSKGVVTQIRVVRSAGNGFDEAAKQLIKKFRFQPATDAQGRKVAVWIPWTYKFRLSG